jgi:hypothetical protein
MSPLILTVEERLRACIALCEALRDFAHAASEPLIRDVAGCQCADVVKMTPGFCLAIIQHVALVRGTLPADALNLTSASRDGRR